MTGKRDPLGGFAALATSAGKLLAADDGPRIAVLDTNGWDTHARSRARSAVSSRLACAASMPVSAPCIWRSAQHGSERSGPRRHGVRTHRCRERHARTDHGTATCAWPVGGAVAGGRVIADWPGLARGSLYQARDLSRRSTCARYSRACSPSTWASANRHSKPRVFPESRSAKQFESLIRS